jgi:DNA-binding NarL/FixJ family response regulator
MPTHITIIIAHSQPLLRLLLQNIFSSKPGIAIAAVVANTSGLLKAIAIHRPDIIVADISLPRMPRLPQLAALAQQEKPPGIIFWWQYCHEPLVRKMINNTACFIAEDAPLSAYVVALKEVMKGAIKYIMILVIFQTFLKSLMD